MALEVGLLDAAAVLESSDRTLDELLKDPRFKIALTCDLRTIAIGHGSTLGVLRAQPASSPGCARWTEPVVWQASPEERDAITSLLWINEGHIAAGYIDGAIRVFNTDGENVLCLPPAQGLSGSRVRR